jgi:hypothetical protein
MTNGIKITIPEPCSQNWQDLTIVEQGRFCAFCEKVVIDFRKMSDNESLDYFKNHQGNVCGNFNPIQTDRLILPLEYASKTSRFTKFFASVFGIFLSLNAKSQSVDSTQRKPITEINLLPTGNKIVETSPLCPMKIEEPLIRGSLGGVCIKPTVVKNNGNVSLKNHVFNRIEDILRYF